MKSFEEVVRQVSKECDTISNCKKCALQLDGGCSFAGVVNNTPEIKQKNIDHVLSILNKNNVIKK